MGFSALQGKISHEALLSRQDAEIRLIETMKRCLSQKAKCDKEYSMAINNLTQQGLKVDRGDDFLGKTTSFKYIHFTRNFILLRKKKTKYINWRGIYIQSGPLRVLNM